MLNSTNQIKSKAQEYKDIPRLSNSLFRNFIYYGIILSNIIFIILFLTLSYHNRYSLDDFYFIADVEKYGVINGTINEYKSWSGRWASGFFNRLIISFNSFKYTLPIFGVFTFMFFIYSVFSFLSKLKSTLFNTFKKTDLWFRVQLSILIVSLFFYSTVNINETWFWLCSTNTYLIPVILFFWGFSKILDVNKGFISFFIIMLSFAYIGGSSEPFAILVLLILLFLIFIIKLKKLNVKLIIEQTNNIKLIFAFVICLASFVVHISADGNYVRKSMFNEVGFIESLFLNIKMIGIIVLKQLKNVIIYIIIFSMPAYFLGRVSLKKYSMKIYLVRIILASIVYVLTLYLFQLPVTYVTGDVMAYRALFPISILTLFYFAYLFYLCGKVKLKTFFKPEYTLIVFTIFLISLNFVTLINQFKILPKYSKAYDLRMEYLYKQNKTNAKDVIILETLPNSGLLNSAEISDNPNHFSNIHLQQALGIEAKLKKRK